MTPLGFARKMIGVSPLPMIVSRLRPGLRVVLYHHVGDENDLTRCLGCTTSEETFESHVDWFSRNYDVVSLSDVLSDRPLPPRALLITFDDPKTDKNSAICAPSASARRDFPVERNSSTVSASPE